MIQTHRGGIIMEIKYNKTLEDISVRLLKLYSQNKLIYVSFLENGYTNDISGIIKNIDFVEKEIVMIPSKKIPIFNIIKISEIS
jgi:hypothetical protein